MIEFKNVSISRRDKCILSNMSFKMNSDILNIISGKSGSGKTSILNAIFELTCVVKGKIFIDNNEVDLSTVEKKQQHKKRIGYSYQDFRLFEDFTILDNIMYTISDNSKSTLEKEGFVEMLESLNLNGVLPKYPSELSGGEKQRVSLCIALLKRPQIILADEPTGNLDRVNANLVIEALLKSNQLYGTCVILATHDSEILSNINYKHFIIDKKTRSVL